MAPDEADRMIYEKSNTYRLHADNLRWTLLAGYAAFFVAVLSNVSGISARDSDKATLAGFLFLVSTCYLFILAVQNWFYNLFSRFVTECEDRICQDERLRTLENFAQNEAQNITPFHPAFFFALGVVALGSSFFLVQSLRAAFYPEWQSQPTWITFLITPSVSVIYTLIGLFIFSRWDALVYRRFIKRFSNLFAPKKVIR
jgi:hypothetical protein